MVHHVKVGNQAKPSQRLSFLLHGLGRLVHSELCHESLNPGRPRCCRLCGLLAEQVVSGRREKLSEEQLIEAIELSQWSFEHPEVFAGQTSSET